MLRELMANASVRAGDEVLRGAVLVQVERGIRCFIMDTIHDVDFGKLGSLTHDRMVTTFNSAENRHPVSRIYLSRVTSAEAALVMVFRPVSGTCMAPS